MALSTQAQPDTVVLNTTERRFPETHPGKVFVVSKVVVNGQQSLKKSAAGAEAAAPAAAPEALRRAASRDVMGRSLQGGEYTSRMARIREKHALPVAPASRTAQAQVARGKNGSAIRLAKSEDARLALVSNSPLVKNPDDLARLERAERQALRRKYGALSPEFAEKISRSPAGQPLDVAIELAKDHPGFVDVAKASLKERKANAQAWARSKPKVSLRDFAASQGLNVESKDLASKGSVLKARVMPSRILELARHEQIVSIVEAKPLEVTAINGPPVHYDRLIDAAYNPPGTMTNYGANVATLEKGLTPQYVACIDAAHRPFAYDSYGTSRDGHSGHSEGTYHTLAIGTPGSTRRHYSNDGQYDMFDHIKSDIINDGVEVITTSFANPWSTEINSDSRVVDAFAYIGPYPIIVMSAGNGGHELLTVSRTYNSLIAGNVQHYDDAHYTVNFSQVQLIDSVFTEVPVVASQSKNPSGTKYGMWYDDWELPTLLAPGWPPDPWWGLIDSGHCIHKDSIGGLWAPGGGTSYSSPALGAMAANVFGATGGNWSASASWMTRAALLVTAQNVHGSQANSWEDQLDGFGTVSGSNGVKFIENAIWVSPSSTAQVEGIAYGTLDSSDFVSPSPITYNFKIPGSFPSGKHLRVVLTWTSSPGVGTAENELSDLVLEATDNSESWFADRANGNVETIEFEYNNGQFTNNGQYEIKIHPSIFRKASDGPGYLQYSLAWSWVKSQAD